MPPIYHLGFLSFGDCEKRILGKRDIPERLHAGLAQFLLL